MSEQDRRYNDEEVSAIIRRALSKGGHRETINHDELAEIATSSGISRAQLEEAIVDEERLGDLDEAKAIWLKRLRREFYSHLTSYCIINGFLLFVNVFTTRYPWVLWPMMGWGIGIAFHAVNTFFVDEEKVERGARRMLRKRQRRLDRMAEQNF